MAQLIRPKKTLHQWLLRKKLKILPKNHLIPLSALSLAHEQLEHLDAQRLLRRNLVKDFCQKKDALIKTGLSRGSKSYQADLAAQVIAVVIDWHLAIKKESLAIETIARKIAANITASPTIIVQDSGSSNEIEHMLSQSIFLCVYLSEDKIERMSNKYQAISMIFGQKPLFYPNSQQHKDQVLISTRDTKTCLDFDERYIDRILSSVSRYLSEKVLEAGVKSTSF